MDRQRFRELWARCRVDGEIDGADEVFDELYRHYSGPGRFYHTPEHIVHCLSQFDMARNLMAEPDAIEMALWFHDVIYDARACDNEIESARLFERLVAQGVAWEFRRKVWDLIMVTVHKDVPGDDDQRFMVDIDLSSFGLPWEDMQRDSDAVRSEFAHLSEEDYRVRQRAFLHALLDRSSFCFTEFFRGRHERAAQENIRRTVESMEGP